MKENRWSTTQFDRPPMTKPRTLEEQLADAQHDIWSHWMRWFFDNDTPQNRERWKRQMVTPYAELSESERESDRRVVRQFLGFVAAALREAADAARREEREALREWAKQTSYRDVIALNQVLAWIDARSRPEEPRPGGLNSPTG